MITDSKVEALLENANEKTLTNGQHLNLNTQIMHLQDFKFFFENCLMKGTKLYTEV